MNEIYQRKLTVKTNTADPETRSISAVVATENPVDMWRLGRRMPEILPVSGVTLPESVRLLNSHQRWDLFDVLGSAREFAVDGGLITARAYFSDTEKGREGFALYRDDHATDFSVGYRVDEYDADLVKDGAEKIVNGRQLRGPVFYATKWTLLEVSAAPIGADPAAKARAESNINREETRTMEAEKVEETRAEKPEVKQTAPAATIDIDAIRAEALSAERKRVSDIGACCRQFGIDPAGYVEAGKSVEEVRAEVLAELARKQAAAPAIVADDEKDKLTRHMSDGVCLRIGLPIDEQMRGQANPFYSMSAMELAKDVLRRSGVNTAGMDVNEIAARAMTSSDFANVINTTAYKSLKMGFAEKPYKWQMLCDIGSESNFLPRTKVEVSNAGTLTKLTTENPEYPFKSLSDAAETYKLDTYAGAWAFSRKMLINDQLNAILNMRKLGDAAARTVETTFFAYIESNPTMGDGVALFNAAHGNIAAGATIDPPSLATFNAAELAMSNQLDLDGVTKLDIMPVFFVGPTALKGYTSQFLGSPWWNDEAALGTPDSSTATTRKNVWAGRLQEVYTAHLSSTTGWYFFGPKGYTFQVFFLNGRQEPIMETSIDFLTKDLRVTVSMDFGVRAHDYRAVYYNAGT